MEARSTGSIELPAFPTSTDSLQKIKWWPAVLSPLRGPFPNNHDPRTSVSKRPRKVSKQFTHLNQEFIVRKLPHGREKCGSRGISGSWRQTAFRILSLFSSIRPVSVSHVYGLNWSLVAITVNLQLKGSPTVCADDGILRPTIKQDTLRESVVVSSSLRDWTVTELSPFKSDLCWELMETRTFVITTHTFYRIFIWPTPVLFWWTKQLLKSFQICLMYALLLSAESTCGKSKDIQYAKSTKRATISCNPWVW